MGAARRASWSGSSRGTGVLTTAIRRSTAGSRAGRLNASHNCLDRHVEAGRGDRVAFHWFGEEGEERAVTYDDLLTDVQRLANALKARGDRHGRRRRDLPADDSRGRRRDAGLRADRRAAQRRLRRLRARSRCKERMEVSSAKALITADGARRKGKTAPVKAGRRRRHGRPGVARRRSSSSATPASTSPMQDGPRRLLRRDLRGRRPGLPGRAVRRRAPALHPLLVGVDGQAEGHPAHHRRLPDRGRPAPTATSSTSSPRPTSTSARPTSGWITGHYLHRLRPAAQRCHQRDVRGRARLPAQGHLVGARRSGPGHDLLHRADRDPRLHEVGGRPIPRPTT